MKNITAFPHPTLREELSRMGVPPEDQNLQTLVQLLLVPRTDHPDPDAAAEAYIYLTKRIYRTGEAA